MLRVLTLILLLLVALPARADLSLDEFKKLAEELAPKVNLFHDTWEKDPNAEFYGGTTRDYLYWLWGQLREGKTPAELRAMPILDVRKFIIGDSDVDVAAEHELSLNPAHYGIRKIDRITKARFDPSTSEGRSELLQGYIPVEKIRLGRNGFVEWKGVGNGIREIYTGKLTVHFSTPEEFASTHYAKLGLNHPVLLALRYIRLLATDYGKRHGQGYPDIQKLFAIDPASRAQVEKVIREATIDGSLKPYLERPRFRRWLNASAQKAFLSFSEPTFS